MPLTQLNPAQGDFQRQPWGKSKSVFSRTPFPTFWDSDMTVQLVQSKKILGNFTKYEMIPEPIIQLESESPPFITD